MEKSKTKKPVSKVSEKEFVKNTVELNPKLQEELGKTAVISWGRMNPPTIGHEKLANKVAATAKANGGTPIIYLSHSQDAKKNPLSYEDKYMFARAAFGPMIQKSNAKTIIQVMQELDKKYTDIILVVGADRIVEFETLLNKYNGRDFKLNSIKVVSAGERDPDAEGVEGMSASKMRAAAASGDDDAFKSGLPKKLQSLGQEVYDMVRAGMKITEELENEGLLNEAVLNLAQRRRRGLIMRRFKTKIMAARNRAKRKMASTGALEIRARKAAINSIRKKVAGTKGADYANLSPSEKMMIDKRVAQRHAIIGRIAQKLMPKVRKAERERFTSQNAKKNEAFEATFGGEQKKQKRYHQLYNGDKTVKHDGRFKFYKQKKVKMEDTDYSDALALIEQVANDVYNSVQLDESKIVNALFEKSENSGLSLTEISNAYSSGVNSWNKASPFETPSQQGFANVSAVIAEKKYQDTGDNSVIWKSPNTVKGTQAHQLGVGLSLKQMMQHALSNRDMDIDGDVDSLDKKTPADIAGNEKDITKKMKAKNDAEAKHTKPGKAFEGLWDNIRKRRAKGLAPLKPGEAGYPKTLDIGEEGGAGEEGTDKLAKKYKKDTPNQSEKVKMAESADILNTWNNTEPANYVEHLQKFFGQPDELTSKRAVWYNKDGFKRIEVLDEFILHSSPLPHYDYVYCYVNLKVPHELSNDLAKSSESILIDHLKNEVGARCASLSANAVTIQYVIDVVEGNVRPSKSEYEKRIKSMKNMFSNGKRFELEWWPDTTGDTDPQNPYYEEDDSSQSVNEAFENMLNEETQCALITREDIRELEKFADSLLKDYGIDVEFTRHFGDRMSDERNTPCINVKELKDFFRKVYNNKGMKIKGNRGIEAILKDMQKSLNMPVVIDYRDGEVELTFKTIMRKKNFSSPNKVISY
jgi:hypothetical protein